MCTELYDISVAEDVATDSNKTNLWSWHGVAAVYIISALNMLNKFKLKRDMNQQYFRIAHLQFAKSQ